MKMQFVTIADRGVPYQERIHLTVLENANLALYIVLLTAKMAEGSVYSGSRSAYWFPMRNAMAGDTVVLYTCIGNEFHQPRPDGKHNHFYYWGSQHTLFNDAAACAILTELTTWQTGF